MNTIITVNLSFSIFTSTALLPVDLAECSVSNKGCEDEAIIKKNRHHFPNVYVMYVRFTLALTSLLLKLPSDSEILHTGWLMLIGSDLDYKQCH